MTPLFSPQTRNAAVLGELRQRILHGTLKPGDRILADSVAGELGVSRIPVREALRVLEGERQVSYEPHRGYFVTKLRLADLVELNLMCHLLEAEALRRSVPLLREQDLEQMQLALRELDRAHKAADIAASSIANRKFHFAFLEQLEMPRFLREIESLYDQCDGYGSLYSSSRRNRQESRRDHLALLEAAKRREPGEVIALLRAHREHVVGALGDVLQDEARPDSDSPGAAADVNGASPIRKTRSRNRKKPTTAQR
jgi:DNA-binding GntR family transcriptional regulator